MRRMGCLVSIEVVVKVWVFVSAGFFLVHLYFVFVILDCRGYFSWILFRSVFCGGMIRFCLGLMVVVFVFVEVWWL